MVGPKYTNKSQYHYTSSLIWWWRIMLFMPIFDPTIWQCFVVQRFHFLTGNWGTSVICCWRIPALRFCILWCFSADLACNKRLYKLWLLFNQSGYFLVLSTQRFHRSLDIFSFMTISYSFSTIHTQTLCLAPATMTCFISTKSLLFFFFFFTNLMFCDCVHALTSCWVIVPNKVVGKFTLLLYIYAKFTQFDTFCDGWYPAMWMFCDAIQEALLAYFIQAWDDGCTREIWSCLLPSEIAL